MERTCSVIVEDDNGIDHIYTVVYIVSSNQQSINQMPNKQPLLEIIQVYENGIPASHCEYSGKLEQIEQQCIQHLADSQIDFLED